MPLYLTTPIYYVNASPHLGHAYTTVAADVAARHGRQRDEDVFFLTGTDEHGDKIARSAAEAGAEVQEHVDLLADAFRRMTALVDASNDFFIRTTDPQHMAFVGRFWEGIRAGGDVYEDVYAGHYCTACERFYREDEIVDGRCPIHGIPVEWIEETNEFFRLSAYAERLLALYDERPDFVVPRARMNETRAFVEAGLEDVSISRASISWGIPLPWRREQIFYVWIDALLNYASALTYARPGEDLTGRYWPPRWQLLGKDILRFHAVIWPAMLLAAGYEPPRQLMVHGYLTVRDAKMSKTTGNVLDPFLVVERYGVDALRYYLLRDVRFGGDGNVSYDALHARYHGELANDLGNLVSRSLAMVGRYRGGRLPDGQVVPEAAAALETARDAVADHVDRLELTEALDAAWVPVRLLNRLVEERAPWTLARDPERTGELDDVLYTLVDGVRAVAVILHAVMPGSTARILAAVGTDGSTAWGEAAPGRSAAGTAVGIDGPLFPRVDGPL